MAKVVAVMSLSLDGFIADSEGGLGEVFGWQFSGDVEVDMGEAAPAPFKMSQASADYFRSLSAELGAVVAGRRTFQTADGWGGNHPWGPAFVLTHHVPDGWPRPSSSVHFVSDGLQNAVERAKAAANGKNVAIHGADAIQQCLNAGLLDEINVDVVAFLLGAGVRLFEHLTNTPIALSDPEVTAGVGVTHLRYRVPTVATGGI